jgi:hypothetical protein
LGAMRSKSGGDQAAREDESAAAEKQRVVQVRQQLAERGGITDFVAIIRVKVRLAPPCRGTAVRYLAFDPSGRNFPDGANMRAVVDASSVCAADGWWRRVLSGVAPS